MSFEDTFFICFNLYFSEKVQYNEENGRRKQFHGFLIVINNNNLIIKFALTKSGKLSELGNVFQSAKEVSNIEAIFSDNCCKDRNSLQSVFSAECVVKLDCFHATNRLIRSFKHKSETELRQFSHDVKFIVRQNSDRHDDRTMPTASPEVILKNLQDLKSTWKSSLSDETINQIDNLVKHARKGCMSDIPVSMGTHNNENIHRQFNAFLHDRRNVSLEMFIALFSVFALMHNRKIAKNPLPLISKPIEIGRSEQCSLDGYGIIEEETDMQTFPPIQFDFERLQIEEKDNINKMLNNVCLLEEVCEKFYLLNKTKQPEMILSCCQWQGQKLDSTNDLLQKLCLDFSRIALKEPLSFVSAIEKMCKANATQDYIDKLATENEEFKGKADLIGAIIDTCKFNYTSRESVATMCNALGIVLVVLTGNIACPIQCMVPSTVLSNVPVILAMEKDVFHLTMFKSNIETLPVKKKKCRCHGSCLPGSGCSCSNKKFSCNEKPR